MWCWSSILSDQIIFAFCKLHIHSCETDRGARVLLKVVDLNLRCLTTVGLTQLTACENGFLACCVPLLVGLVAWIGECYQEFFLLFQFEHCDPVCDV